MLVLLEQIKLILIYDTVTENVTENENVTDTVTDNENVNVNDMI